MGLTFGKAPFSPDGGGEFNVDLQMKGLKYWEPWSRRLRAVRGGETVCDTVDAVILFPAGSFPQHWIPERDVRLDLLDEHVITRFDADRSPGGPPLTGYVRLDWAAMDRWFEEDDAVYAHLRDPYHRVDVRSSSRHVVVRHGDTVVAESNRPKLLFETSVPTRYYLPFDDVSIGLFSLSDEVSECPYKGDGQHWHLTVGGETVEDAAWSLPHPLPEAFAAAEHLCFYPDKVRIEVDDHGVTS